MNRQKKYILLEDFLFWCEDKNNVALSEIDYDFASVDADELIRGFLDTIDSDE